MEKKKYYGIDWLRAFACIGIALMHIRANSSYVIPGSIYNKYIPSLTDFVYLFMAISAFVMCLGYYDKVMFGRVDWTSFYKKRYIRILPFFAFLVCVDVIRNHDSSSLFEGLTELTLLHGFAPQELSVIGVGWYLGTVFVFYLVFPFFCVLIENKKRAWISFLISVLIHYIALYYFDLSRHNILYSMCYFLVGGLIFQYRDKLVKVSWCIYVLLFVAILMLYYGVNTYGVGLMLLVFILLSFSISIRGGTTRRYPLYRI